MSDSKTLGKNSPDEMPAAKGAAQPSQRQSGGENSHLLADQTPYDNMFNNDTTTSNTGLLENADGLEDKVAKLEKKLRKYQARIESVETMLGKVQAGLAVIDREGKLLYFNTAFERLYGLEDMRTKRKGRPKKNRFLQEKIHDPDVLELAKKVRRTGETASTTYQQSGGLNRFINLIGHPLPEYASNVLLVFRDVTNEARLESLRKDFVANVSHELRTPLAAIMGYLETLLEPDGLDNKQQGRHFLGIVRRHAERLDALIADLLELSRLEAEDASANDQYHDAVSLREVIQRPIEVVRPKAMAKPITILSNVPRHLPLVQGSKGPLEQVIINILTNAIKYSDPETTVSIEAHVRLCRPDNALKSWAAEYAVSEVSGNSFSRCIVDALFGSRTGIEDASTDSVADEAISDTEIKGAEAAAGELSDGIDEKVASAPVIEVAQNSHTKHAQMVVITISDEGIGIEEEHLDRIFERFYRVDKDRSRAAGGTGLGLSIVKHIVQRCGGALFVKSELDKGSSFSICLPVVVD